MQALHKMVKDDELPMGSSALWNLMLSARPLGSTLDVKRSKHKKLGAFLKVGRAQTGLLLQLPYITLLGLVWVPLLYVHRLHPFLLASMPGPLD